MANTAVRRVHRRTPGDPDTRKVIGAILILISAAGIVAILLGLVTR
ncbi:hypothetical protein [Micromonospora sp. NPDC049891]